MTPTKPRPISILITDLDDTLYDWVSVWHASFTAMIGALVEATGLTQEELERDFKTVFTKHGTSEYAFAIQELPSLIARFPGEDLTVKFNSAIHAYRKARKATLALFPTVAETLAAVKSAGCLIVGYTESPAFYTGQRLKALRLDGVLDYLYSSPDHDLPPGAEELRQYDKSSYELHRTEHRQTAKGTLKPNPDVLLGIVRELGGDIEATAYIGDKLVKDVGMAQDAGILDIHATYAAPLGSAAYEQLRRVSHWTPAAVERERVTTSKDIAPTHAVSRFGDLLQFVSPHIFVPPRPVGDPATGHVLDAWKSTIEVQQHFNDLELRIRNFGLTIALAAFGAAGWALKERIEVSFWGWSVAAAALAMAAGCLGWFLCYVMDRHWYHRMLQGAVSHSGYIEKRMRHVLPELALSRAIGRASPFQLFGFAVHSNERVDAFYLLVAIPLVMATLFLFITGVKHASVDAVVQQPTALNPAAPSAVPQPPVSPLASSSLSPRSSSVLKSSATAQPVGVPTPSVPSRPLPSLSPMSTPPPP